MKLDWCRFGTNQRKVEWQQSSMRGPEDKAYPKVHHLGSAGIYIANMMFMNDLSLCINKSSFNITYLSGCCGGVMRCTWSIGVHVVYGATLRVVGTEV